MAFKQPRIPEYRTGEEVRVYLRTLILFLKDFCRDAWAANRMREEDMSRIRRDMAEIRVPVTSVNAKTGEVTLTASDVGALGEDGTAKNAAKLDGKTAAEWMLALYPVGSIYLAVHEISPASLFGGTWEQIKDRFLLGAGEQYAQGETGGTAEETLSVEQIPSHTHAMHTRAVYAGDGSYVGCCKESQAADLYASGSTGGGAAHNNMPPYLAVYMWKRIS